ncbi:phenylalanine--tRNA ligase subunit beta [Roseivirga misakiensis]|uniref:Phenylalanine--tRNA ligase beta subunit n=1 Tax=Roseivirga misakiensis TaxID=1563681 RepID=A0A1E5T4W0_9BACT|nr:phenylalanine--tRNA ligase subunit beta [Roseivirga misakiensis]OEK06413.1 phenylalanine--tRNA ligase subunit beta [Roseivirga misakiensis]
MKISLNWLKQYIDLPETPQEISKQLTSSGLEVEGLEEIESIKGGLKGLVIGEVLTCEKHPGADKLSITTVDIGQDTPAPIVCGAPNVAAGQKVVVATVNTMLYPAGGDPFKIKKAKIRGEVSEGMICAEDEIGLGSGHDGILVLDTDLPNGTPASTYFKVESDFVYEIGLTPNRADAASHLGTARDLKALFNREVKLPSIEEFKIDSEEKTIKVSVENTEACPRYSGLTMTGLTVTDSPDWLKAKLNAIGINPTNNVVDVTNYVLHSLGQPMHAFDADAITGNEVIVKTLPKDTTFTTLDEKERKLSARDLMICNTEEGMCIAGVFGGIKSGVTESTTSIFLESAYFSPDYIRKTAQTHQLKTDASFRYERGTDPNITVYALKYAALLIQELAGGKVTSEITDIYPEPIADFKVPVKYKNIDRLIGKAIGNEKIDAILESLDIQLTDQTGEGFTAVVPAYRVDVQREADIVEEVLRIYGYNNIELKDTLSSSFLSEFPQRDSDAIQLEVSRILSGAGFNEIVTNSLTKKAYSESTSSLAEEENVNILNYLSEELTVMRQSLLFNGLEVIDRNIKRRQNNLSLYEFGRTYHKVNDKYKEHERLAIFITGENLEENWQEKKRPVQYHDLSQIISQLLDKFGVKQYDVNPVESDIFSYGLTISTRKKPLVSLGKVNAKLAAKNEVKQEVFMADIDWDFMKSIYPLSVDYKPLSKFPEVKRDLSLVVDKAINFDQIRRLAMKLERQLITRLNVFDVYEGDKIGENEKAYAISFFLQDQEKTLNDKVIDKTMSRLMHGFEKELGAIIRK